MRWDYTHTRPQQLSSLCHKCLRDRKNEQDHARREAARLNGTLVAMPREDRFSYQLEGGLPLPTTAGGWSLATEDYDPTPVPQGCPSCYLHGGNVCTECPDADVKLKKREAKRQGLIQGLLSRL